MPGRLIRLGARSVALNETKRNETKGWTHLQVRPVDHKRQPPIGPLVLPFHPTSLTVCFWKRRISPGISIWQKSCTIQECQSSDRLAIASRRLRLCDPFFSEEGPAAACQTTVETTVHTSELGTYLRSYWSSRKSLATDRSE